MNGVIELHRGRADTDIEDAVLAHVVLKDDMNMWRSISVSTRALELGCIVMDKYQLRLRWRKLPGHGLECSSAN